MGVGLERACREARNKNIEDYKRRKRMYTRHHVVYEIYNHEEGTLAFFEHYENVERWEEDNAENPSGYKDFGLDGYSPEVVMVGLYALTQGQDHYEAIDEFLYGSDDD